MAAIMTIHKPDEHASDDPERDLAEQLATLNNRLFRFTHMLGGVLVACPELRKRERIGIVVRLDNEKAQWACYCSDVRFVYFRHDGKACDFISCGRMHKNVACRVLWPDQMGVQGMVQAAKELWQS